MINEITEKLDVREEVKNFRIKHLPIKLKAGDKVFIREDLEDGKEYRYGYRFFKRTMKTGENVVKSVIDDLIRIEEDIHNRYTSDMIDWGQTAILNALKAPSFDDLIDVVVQAKKDGAVSRIYWDSVGVLTVYRGSYDTTSIVVAGDGVSSDFIADAIKTIESCYTETFKVCDLESLQRVREGAEGELANGSKFKVLRDSNKYAGRNMLYIEFESERVNHASLEILEGATVTQKRGARYE